MASEDMDDVRKTGPGGETRPLSDGLNSSAPKLSANAIR